MRCRTSNTERAVSGQNRARSVAHPFCRAHSGRPGGGAIGLGGALCETHVLLAVRLKRLELARGRKGLDLFTGGDRML
eukprot:1715501-Prymnesium_polylepis.3